MNAIFRIFAAVSMLAGAVLSGSPVSAADPAQVFMDARDPAFVVVQGVAADAGAQALTEMGGYATLENVSLMSWEAFRVNAQALIAPHILKDEYAGAGTVAGLVALVKAYPGKPFAVTWNGGLAVSFHDYQYAVETRRAFLDNAQAWEASRPRASDDDPLDPARNISRLLQQGF